ncbi:QcrA and Rieske domain-containing protein [Flavobacterium restrictum]|uniref:Rieske 2Fe-2S domain-containing protein n=1 Tax=Flavobacterium restrictum TaxID=2594428 RepID=A0A553E8D5_9FLAO|nr:Rieske (2Fe-2S) protein [Flavobacterium restrictum]TRX41297.1 Rieske 2Fe-2S domain-containing protein [Flavobacterium restrictum]
MNRKEFFARVGFGAAAILVPACIAGLATSCQSEGSPSVAPSNVDFNVDVSSGSLATNGGFMVSNGIVIARTLTGSYLAVSASCTHQGTNVNYDSTGNKFVCPNHGAQFSSTGAVTQGPASSNLKMYNTALSGNTLRIYS